MHFKSLGDHATKMFTVFLLIEYATLSFEAYFSLGVCILIGQISWVTFLTFIYLISEKKLQCKKLKRYRECFFKMFLKYSLYMYMIFQKFSDQKEYAFNFYTKSIGSEFNDKKWLLLWSFQIVRNSD
jgi:hypothetical protein